jgi:hypothetical protein
VIVEEPVVEEPAPAIALRWRSMPAR